MNHIRYQLTSSTTQPLQVECLGCLQGLRELAADAVPDLLALCETKTSLTVTGGAVGALGAICAGSRSVLPALEALLFNGEGVLMTHVARAIGQNGAASDDAILQLQRLAALNPFAHWTTVRAAREALCALGVAPSENPSFMR